MLVAARIRIQRGAEARASDSRVINWELFSPSFDTFFFAGYILVFRRAGYANIVSKRGKFSHPLLGNVTVRMDEVVRCI